MTQPTGNRRDGWRRALLPAWPPESVAEALLLVACSASLALLIELWGTPPSLFVAQTEVREATLALLAGLGRLLALGLLLGLAARLTLGLDIRAAIAAGGVVLVAAWAPPLVTSVGGPAVAPAWSMAALAAPLAVAVAARVRVGWLRRIGFVAVAAALAVGVAHHDAIHAWLLGGLGLAVRGALVPGLSGEQRAALDAVPLLAATLLLWSALGGAAARQPWRLVLRRWPASGLALAALAAFWGYATGAAQFAALPALLQPPAIYALVALLTALALVAAALVRLPAAGNLADTAALLVAAALFAYAAGDGAIAVVAACGLLLLPGGRRGGAWAPVTGAVRAGLLALALAVAGRLVLPGPFPDAGAALGLGVAGLLAAGLACGGLAATSGRGPLQAAWAVLYGSGLAVSALAQGLHDLLGMCAVATALLVLLALRGAPAFPLRVASVLTAGLAGLATAMLAGG